MVQATTTRRPSYTSFLLLALPNKSLKLLSLAPLSVGKSPWFWSCHHLKPALPKYWAVATFLITHVVGILSDGSTSTYHLIFEPGRQLMLFKRTRLFLLSVNSAWFISLLEYGLVLCFLPQTNSTLNRPTGQYLTRTFAWAFPYISRLVVCIRRNCWGGTNWNNSENGMYQQIFAYCWYSFAPDFNLPLLWCCVIMTGELWTEEVRSNTFSHMMPFSHSAVEPIVPMSMTLSNIYIMEPWTMRHCVSSSPRSATFYSKTLYQVRCPPSLLQVFATFTYSRSPPSIHDLSSYAKSTYSPKQVGVNSMSRSSHYSCFFLWQSLSSNWGRVYLNICHTIGYTWGRVPITPSDIVVRSFRSPSPLLQGFDRMKPLE